MPQNRNVFGEVIHDLSTGLHGFALNYHRPDLDLNNILLATDGSVKRENICMRLPVDRNPPETTLYKTDCLQG